MKKTRFFMMGILSFALVFGFIGCGGDSLTPPFTPPSVGDLPALPTDGGVTAVTADDVDALLSAVKDSGISSSIKSAIEDAIGDRPSGTSSYDWKYDFTDKAQGGFKVSAKKTQSVDTNATLGADGHPVNPQPGQYYRESSENSSKAVISDEAGITESSITALKDSYFQSLNTSSTNATVTSGGISGERGSLEQYIIGFTVKSSDKAGRIVLDAKQSWSTTSFESGTGGSRPRTYSGSLKVYGADNDTPVKTITITDLTTANQALAYFGLGFHDYSN